MGLSRPIPGETFEEAFASGYGLGELLSRMAMQPDFHEFQDKTTPEAMVANFSRLQMTLQRMGIELSSATANQIMMGARGAAAQLVYQIKSQLDTLRQELGTNNASGSRLSRTLGVRTKPSLALLETRQAKGERKRYDAVVSKVFEDTLKTRAQNPSQLTMALQLQKFSEAAAHLQADQLASARDALDTRDQRARTRRAGMRESVAVRREVIEARKERDLAAHLANRQRQRDFERDELRIELAVRERRERKKRAALMDASVELADGIAEFERNLRSVADGPAARTSAGGGAQGSADKEAETMPTFSSTTPLEHLQNIKTMLPDARAMRNEGAEYLGRMRAKRAEEAAARKERERRRRKSVLEQSRAQAAMEERRREAELLDSLRTGALEEQRLAGELWQLRQEKEVMRENRAFRESQYAERRARDFEESLERNRAAGRADREAFEAATRDEAARLAAEAEARRQAGKQAVVDMCRDLVGQMAGLAERAAEYRARTDALVPRKEWREWTALFVAGELETAAPLVNEGASPAEAVEEGAESEAVALTLDDAAVRDYLASRGEWEWPAGVPENDPLGGIVYNLKLAIAPPAPKMPVPDLSALSCRVAITGAPFAGAELVAKAVAEAHSMALLDPQELVTKAIEAAKAAKAKPAGAQDEGEGEEGAGTDVAESAEAGTEGAKAPRKSSVVEALGAQVEEALLRGEEVSDKVVVGLVVNAMAEMAAAAGASEDAEGESAPQGFILSDFPRTEAQAVLLEKALTNLDLNEEASQRSRQSVIAPPGARGVPDEDRMLVSGLDAVVVLSVSDESVALRRALGGRLNPETGRTYHLEYDPPPEDDDTGLLERLVEAPGASNDAMQVQARLEASLATMQPLEAWLDKLRVRRAVSTNAGIDAGVKAVGEEMNSILTAKAATKGAAAAAQAAAKSAEDARAAGEAAAAASALAADAAKLLIATKRAEVEAAAALDDGGEGEDKSTNNEAAQLVTKQAAEEAASTLLEVQARAKECADKATEAQAAADATQSMAEEAARLAGEASGSAGAEAAQAAAEAAAATAAEARAAAQAAEGSKASAAKSLAQAEDKPADKDAKEGEEKVSAEEEETVEDGGPVAEDGITVEDGAVPAEEAPAEEEGAVDAAEAADEEAAQPEPDFAEILGAQWEELEATYLEGLRRVAQQLRAERLVCMRHLVATKQQFVAFLRRPDDKMRAVTDFQRAFNAVDADLRRDSEAKEELQMRADELRDTLWDQCDDRRQEAEAERAAIVADSFIADHRESLSALFNALAEIEADRVSGSAAVVVDYVLNSSGNAVPENAFTPPDTSDATQALLDSPPEWLGKVAERAPALAPGLAKLVASAEAVGSAEVAQAEGGEQDAEGEQGAGKVSDPSAVAVRVLRGEASAAAARAERIGARACAYFDELDEIANNAHERLNEWLAARYAGECGAVAALADTVRAAVEAEEPLPHDLRLEGEDLVISEELLAMPPTYAPPPPPPPPRAVPEGAPSFSQVERVVAALAQASGGGSAMPVDECTEVLRRLAAAGGLPERWGEASQARVLAAVRAFDPLASGQVDWRLLVASLLCQSCPEASPVTLEGRLEASNVAAAAAVSREELSTMGVPKEGVEILWSAFVGEGDTKLNLALLLGGKVPELDI